MLFLLPESKYHLATAALDEMRAADACSFYAVNNANERLAAEANVISRGDLVEGHRYGILSFSPTATARRDGKWLTNHGDAYIIVWTYRGNNRLTNNSAWGNIAEKSIRDGMLLLELPG